MRLEADAVQHLGPLVVGERHVLERERLAVQPHALGGAHELGRAQEVPDDVEAHVHARDLAARLREQAALRPEGSGPLRVLSIGSGVGYMEHCLVEEMSADELELHVNEPSTVSMRWLRRHVPNERMYIGMPPACLPPDVFYDVIYLSAVDYSIPTRELQHLLGELRAQLVPGGQLICLSASLLQEDSFIGSFVNALKIVIRGFLHFLGIRRQQFWGWRRTRDEYRELLRKADFRHLEDGWLEDGFETYWIRGC